MTTMMMMRQRVFMKCHAEATSLRCRAIFMGGHQCHVSLLPCHLSTSCFVQMSWHGFKWWCAGELCLVLVSFPPRFVFAQLFLIAATHFWGTADTSGSFYLWLVPPPPSPPKNLDGCSQRSFYWGSVICSHMSCSVALLVGLSSVKRRWRLCGDFRN